MSESLDMNAEDAPEKLSTRKRRKINQAAAAATAAAEIAAKTAAKAEARANFVVENPAPKAPVIPALSRRTKKSQAKQRKAAATGALTPSKSAVTVTSPTKSDVIKLDAEDGSEPQPKKIRKAAATDASNWPFPTDYNDRE